MHDISFWLDYLMEREHVEGVNVGANIILKQVVNKENWRIKNGLIWLRMRTSDGFP
jgi:hypothetical protein